jgi:hypothetical protein
MEEYKICFKNYEVSNFGNVRKKMKSGTYKNIKGSLLNQGTGYKYFQIQEDGKRINYLFHHLVAKLFIGDRPNNLVIDHLDRNSLNNNVNNLRYITQRENMHNQHKYINDILEEGNERQKIISKLWYKKQCENPEWVIKEKERKRILSKKLYLKLKNKNKE